MRHQLLILYRHASAIGDELRWCLRSLSNVDGCRETWPIVVGDPPEWYTGPRLELPPLGGRISDTRNKFRAIIDSPLVAEEFVLFADDNVVVGVIDFDDLQVPRSQPARTSPPSPAGGWQQQRWETAEYCRAARFEQRETRKIDSMDLASRDSPLAAREPVDVSTHWPYCWAKSKLAATLDLIGDRPLLIETVYANHHQQPTNPAHDFRYVNHGRGICEEARVISYNDAAFHRGVRAELHRRFPDPCPWETGPVPTLPTLGRIDHRTMHACEMLGNPIRVEGKHVIFHCAKLGEAALFAGHANICEQCDHYQMTNRVVKIGKPSARIAGRPRCRAG